MRSKIASSLIGALIICLTFVSCSGSKGSNGTGKSTSNAHEYQDLPDEKLPRTDDDYTPPEHPVIVPPSPVTTPPHEIDPTSPSPPEPVTQSCTSDGLLEIARKKLSPSEFSRFEKIYLSFFFFDPYQVIFQNSLAGPSGISEPEQFNIRGEYPFDGYLAARRLFNSAKAIDFELMKKAHEALLSKKSISQEHLAYLKKKRIPPANSEHASDSELGTIRDACWGFKMADADYQSGYTDEHIMKLSEKPIRNRDMLRINHFLSYENVDNLPLGQVLYPCTSNALSISKIPDTQVFSPTLKKRIKTVSALLNELNHATDKAAEKSIQDRLKTAVHSDPVTEQRLVTDLMNYEIGIMGHTLSSHPTQDQVVKAVARFYRNMVGIHPFPNGNGRTSRLTAEMILGKFGINPPIYTYWGQDVMIREESFEKVFKEAITLSNSFHEGACENFKGVGSLNLSALFQLDNKPVSLVEYFSWLRENNLALDIDAKNLDSDENLKQIMGPNLQLYREFQLGKGVNVELLRETDADPYEVWKQRELRLFEALARPLQAQRDQVYSWQTLDNIAHYAQYGQDGAHLELRTDIHYKSNFAGNGLYVSLNPYDSSQYAKIEGDQPAKSLMTIKVPHNEKVIDLTDPHVLGRLYENGITEREIYYMNTGFPVGYWSTAVKTEWLVYKKSIPPTSFKRASADDFDPSELTRYRVRLDHEDAEPEIDKIIQEAKVKYEQTLLNSNSHADLFWSPLGECRQKQDHTYPVVAKEICEKSLGVVHDFDPQHCTCVSLTPDRKIVIGQLAREACSDIHKGCQPQIFKAPFVEYLLPQDANRTSNELQNLYEYHYQADLRKKGYWILARNQYLDMFLKFFPERGDAIDYLRRVPAPFDLNRYVDRVFRNQKEFENGLQGLVQTLNRPGTFESNLSVNSKWDKTWYLKKSKEDIFKILQYFKSLSPDTGYSPERISFDPVYLRTVELKAYDGGDLEKIEKHLGKMKGFVIKLEEEKDKTDKKDKDAVRLVPSIKEGKEFERGSTIIEGYQDGIPIRLRVRFENKVPDGYTDLTLAKLRDEEKIAQDKYRDLFNINLRNAIDDLQKKNQTQSH